MPPSIREAVPDRVFAVIGLLLFVTFAYAVLVAGQVLLWFFLVVVVGGGIVLLWLFWRLVRAHERLADAATAMAVDDGGTPALDDGARAADAATTDREPDGPNDSENGGDANDDTNDGTAGGR